MGTDYLLEEHVTKHQSQSDISLPVFIHYFFSDKKFINYDNNKGPSISIDLSLEIKK